MLLRAVSSLPVVAAGLEHSEALSREELSRGVAHFVDVLSQSSSTTVDVELAGLAHCKLGVTERDLAKPAPSSPCEDFGRNEDWLSLVTEASYNLVSSGFTSSSKQVTYIDFALVRRGIVRTRSVRQLLRSYAPGRALFHSSWQDCFRLSEDVKVPRPLGRPPSE